MVHLLVDVAVSLRVRQHSCHLSVAARRLGAHYFFRKPVDAQALIDAIQWVLDPEVQCAAEPQHQR
jgi:FixJ family two-component response regulator